MNPTRHGFSLTETAIATAVLSTLLIGISQSLISGARVSEHVSMSSDMENVSERVLDRLLRDLRSADYEYIYLLNGGIATYSFRTCSGFHPTTGDALYEEGRILIYDSTLGTLSLRSTVVGEPDFDHALLLADGIPPGGFTINHYGEGSFVSGNRLRIDLTLQRENVDGRMMADSASRNLFLRSTLFDKDGLGAVDVPTIDVAENDGTGEFVDPEPVVPVEPEISGSTPISPIVSWGAKLLEPGNGSNRSSSITSSILAPAGESILYGSTEIGLQASQGNLNQVSVYRGWVESEASGRGLSENQFLVIGRWSGSLSVDVATSASGGGMLLQSNSY